MFWSSGPRASRPDPRRVASRHSPFRLLPSHRPPPPLASRLHCAQATQPGGGRRAATRPLAKRRRTARPLASNGASLRRGISAVFRRALTGSPATRDRVGTLGGGQRAPHPRRARHFLGYVLLVLAYFHDTKGRAGYASSPFYEMNRARCSAMLGCRARATLSSTPHTPSHVG